MTTTITEQPSAADSQSLLRSLVPTESFWSQASCAETDPEAFFPEKGESVTQAKAICNDVCTVQKQCREWALARAEEHGVWGGLSGLERKKILKKKKDKAKLDREKREMAKQIAGPNRSTRRAAA